LWEDVEVSLSDIVEVKGDWLEIELQRDMWHAEVYKDAKELEDKWLVEQEKKGCFGV